MELEFEWMNLLTVGANGAFPFLEELILASQSVNYD